MQDAMSLVQQTQIGAWFYANPIAVLPIVVAVVAAVLLITNRKAPTAAQPPVALPEKSDGGKDIEKSSPETPKTISLATLDGQWKSEPHQVASSALQSASEALRTAKEISTPDAPEHVKTAAGALSAAAIKVLDMIDPATKAAVNLHRTEDKQKD
jgi:hypothetical protein